MSSVSSAGLEDPPVADRVARPVGEAERSRGREPAAHRGPDPDGQGRRRRRVHLAAAVATYLALSVLVWSHVWFIHPTAVTVCGCGDSSLFAWFLDWPAYAAAHGLGLLHSTAMGYPRGVNLLSNTSVLALGIPLVPVTWLLGPVATLNVALTLSPFLSACAMLALLSRWCRWVPAAFAGGLIYGFSPYLLFTLTNSHLMLGMAPVPPLVVLVLDDILARRAWGAARSGVALGGLVALQFFIGTEVLVILVVGMVIGTAVLLAAALGGRVGDARARARYAASGLGTAVATAGVLLAYPTWYAFAGPAHLSGDVWGPGDVGSYGGTSLASFVVPAAPNPVNTALDHQFGGYQAPTFSAQYLGAGLLLVAAGGLLLWRRDRRLQLFALMGVVSLLLSFGLEHGSWTPWRLFVHLPELENVIPMRFLVLTYLCAAVVIGLVVDHTRAELRARLTAATAGRAGTRPRHLRLLPEAVALAVAAVAVLPVAGFLATYLPLAARPVSVPAWFRLDAARLPPGRVLLVFPATYATESSESWQVAAGMAFSMVNEGGPGAIPARAPAAERRGQEVLAAISYRLGPAPQLSPGDVAAVHRALAGWGVTTIVLPDDPGSPPYDRVPSPVEVAAVVTAATGELPTHADRAWVWTDATRREPVVPRSGGVIADCTGRAPGRVPPTVPEAARCMLEQGAARTSSTGPS